MKITRIKTRDCYLHTLDGTKEALAHPTFIDGRGKEVANIIAKDRSAWIRVPASTYERKFWNEEKPTFYAC